MTSTTAGTYTPRPCALCAVPIPRRDAREGYTAHVLLVRAGVAMAVCPACWARLSGQKREAAA